MQQQPFVVPDSIPAVTQNGPTIRVPDVFTPDTSMGEEWSYKKFGPMDIFHSKIGIAGTVSILTFAILSFVNPPFIQESNGDNRIETRKPCSKMLYTVSAIVFLFIFLVPVNPPRIEV